MNGKMIGLLVVLCSTLAALGAGWVSAQRAGIEVRIEARRLDDGRVEFALRERGGERELPAKRFFPATGGASWLNSSWVSVGTDGAFAPAPAATPTPAADVSTSLFWEEETTLSGRRDQNLSVVFDGQSPAEFAILFIDCEGGTLDVNLGHDTWMGHVWSNGWNTGTFRVDDGAAQSFGWKRFSTSGRYSDISSRQAAWFLNQLRGGSTLRMSLYSAGTNIGTANITGIDAYLDRLVCLGSS